MGKKNILRVIKIGGNIIDHPEKVAHFLDQFAAIPGAKILVHGGGVLATQLAEQLGIPQTLVEGRRITDAETLRIAVMVYAGWVNKNLVAQLYARECPAIGICGADGDAIRAERRPARTVDYGWVGDVKKVHVELLDAWLAKGLAPVVAPVTHDGQGQLLNTNADTIAQEIAKSLSKAFKVELIYGFEKEGVLVQENGTETVLPQLNKRLFAQLKADQTITGGMIPKLDNAFTALENGVQKIVVGNASQLHALVQGETGTTIVW
jgi:acetylglutamate kinase